VVPPSSPEGIAPISLRTAPEQELLGVSTSSPTETLKRLRDYLNAAVHGQPDAVDGALCAFLSGGHLLLEGPPGTGKTLLSRTLAQAFSGSFRRIQMTSDLLPSDLVGILRPSQKAGEFEFRPGPLFSHFILADELNRTGPKTQSALLEAMAEGTITVDGTTHPLPDPFFVIATQNPQEFHGVFPLAESQRDRFALCVPLQVPGPREEFEILRRGTLNLSEPKKGATQPFTLDEAKALRQLAQTVHVEDSVLEYASRITQATRTRPEVRYGASLRAALQLVAVARARALLFGRDYVIPGDLQALATQALAHRLCLDPALETEDGEARLRQRILSELIERTPAPR